MTSYEISVRGHLDPGLVAALTAGAAHERPASTVLVAEVDDRDGLCAIIDRINALGLELLAARKLGGGRRSA